MNTLDDQIGQMTCQALCLALGDNDTSVRVDAAEALCELKLATREVLKALRTALHDPDLSVRKHAAAALATHTKQLTKARRRQRTLAGEF